MIKLYTKQDISKIMNLSYKTLRIYEEKKLITPVYIHPENGYKYYDEDSFYTIDMIRYSNMELDIPLSNIKAILDNTNPQEALVELLELRKTEAQQMVERYEQIIKNIEHSLNYNLCPKKLLTPYKEHIQGIFTYTESLDVQETHHYWTLAQKIYDVVGHKHIHFFLQLKNTDILHFTKVGTVNNLTSPITDDIKQEVFNDDFLCIQFRNQEAIYYKNNFTSLIKQLDDYAKENQFILDYDNIYIEYHALDISTLKQKDMVATIKIRAIPN